MRRRDRLALVMPQRLETAIAYMAIFQLGAVAMPLSMLFGPQALEYRLQDSEAVVALCDDSSIANLLAVRERCPALKSVVGVGAAALKADLDWTVELSRHPAKITAVKTKADEGAVLIYTSGTTGPPKRSAHPAPRADRQPARICVKPGLGEGELQRRVLVAGRLGWTGGLMDALLPSLCFGRPIVAHNGRFSPELAFKLMQDQGVTHTFLFPTALSSPARASWRTTSTPRKSSSSRRCR